MVTFNAAAAARCSLALLGLVLAGAVVSSTPLLAESPPIQHHVLDNGLEVLLKSEPTQATVSIQTWYQVGSRHETEQSPGYAHLFEHLMMGGTEDNPAFDRAVKRLGGRHGSASWADITVFYLDVEARHLGAALELEADRMRNLLLEGPRIDAMVEAIGSELAGLLEVSPRMLVENRLRALAYGSHGYANPVMGMPAGTITAPSCEAFYDRYYRPRNANLTIAGGFDAAEALALVQVTFGSLEAGDEPAPGAPPAAVGTTSRDALSLGTGPMLSVAYTFIGPPAEHSVGLRLLSTYLQANARRIFTDVKGAGGEPAIVATEVTRLEDLQSTLLVLHLSLARGIEPSSIEASVLDALAGVPASIASLDVDQRRELTEMALFATLSGRNSVSNRASALATAHLMLGGFEQYAAIREAFAPQSAAALSRAASQLQPTGAVTIALHGETP